jgi:hypothetical protein
MRQLKNACISSDSKNGHMKHRSQIQGKNKKPGEIRARELRSNPPAFVLLSHFTNSRPQLQFSSFIVTIGLSGVMHGQLGHHVTGTTPYPNHEGREAEEEHDISCRRALPWLVTIERVEEQLLGERGGIRHGRGDGSSSHLVLKLS